MNKFVSWLTHELNERGWSNSELARRAELVPSTVSMVISERTKPGLEFCLGVARAFGFPPETVLRRAGLLPSVPAATQDEQEMVGIWRTLSESQRKTLLTMLRSLAPRHGYTLATAEEGADYIWTRVDLKLLEVFHELPLEHQERAVEMVERMVANPDQVRFIGEEE